MDYSISVGHLDRHEVLERLKQPQSKANTGQLKKTLAIKLRKHHPIHDLLRSYDIIKLKKICSKISIDSRKKGAIRLRSDIAAYFFTAYPESPLKLKKNVSIKNK